MSKGLITKCVWSAPKSDKATFLAFGRVTVGDAIIINVFVKENKDGQKFVSWPGRMVDGQWMSDVYVPKEANEVNAAVLKSFEADFMGKSGNGGKKKAAASEPIPI